jgi:TonB family protein
MDQRFSLKIRLMLCICLWLGMLSKGWAFVDHGEINADFSYRNLSLMEAGGAYFISGLIENKSDQVQLGIVILVRADDCVTGRTQWKVRLYFDSIDPRLEIPFRAAIGDQDPGFVCKFSFRTGYHLLPPPVQTPAKKRPATHLAAPEAQRSSDTATGVVYTWVDAEGIIHYSILPPELGNGKKARISTHGTRGEGANANSERIYAWIDEHGVTRYSDTPPEPRLLLERERRARETYDTIEAYTRAMHKRVWEKWLRPDVAWPQAGDREVIVRFYVLPDGRIRDIYFEKTSGSDDLDESFYNAVAKSDPLPPLPAKFAEAYLNARIVFTPRGPK